MIRPTLVDIHETVHYRQFATTSFGFWCTVLTKLEEYYWKRLISIWGWVKDDIEHPVPPIFSKIDPVSWGNSGSETERKDLVRSGVKIAGWAHCLRSFLYHLNNRTDITRVEMANLWAKSMSLAFNRFCYDEWLYSDESEKIREASFEKLESVRIDDPDDPYYGPRVFTVREIVEGAARLEERIVLHCAATDSAVEQWSKESLFGPYLPVFVELNHHHPEVSRCIVDLTLNCPFDGSLCEELSFDEALPSLRLRRILREVDCEGSANKEEIIRTLDVRSALERQNLSDQSILYSGLPPELSRGRREHVGEHRVASDMVNGHNYWSRWAEVQRLSHASRLEKPFGLCGLGISHEERRAFFSQRFNPLFSSCRDRLSYYDDGLNAYGRVVVLDDRRYEALGQVILSMLMNILYRSASPDSLLGLYESCWEVEDSEGRCCDRFFDYFFRQGVPAPVRKGAIEMFGLDRIVRSND